MRTNADDDGTRSPGLRERRLRAQRRIFPWTRVFSGSSKRHPGESLNEDLQDVIDDIGIVIFYVLGFSSGWILALTVTRLPLDHRIWAQFIIFAVLITGAAGVLYSLGRRYVRLHKGLRAERKVGDNLDLLQHRGARVVHDIQCIGAKSRFNIDHCVIHPSGIWAIETKFIAPGPNAILDVSDDGFRMEGKTLGDKAIRQVTRNAVEVANIIFKATGKRIWVDSAVLVEGLAVRGSCSKCRVENTESFRSHLHALPVKLKPQQVKDFAQIILDHSKRNEE